MAKRATSIVLDEALLDVLRRVAVEEGVAQDDLIEEAIRRYFGLRGMALLDEIAEGQSAAGIGLGDNEAMELAVSELRAHRAERASSA